MDNDQFTEQFQCPICFEIPEGRVLQCKNDHIICDKCYSNIKSKECPTCRVAFGKEEIRNRALERIITSFRSTLVDCRNKGFGCEEKVARGKLADHLKVCACRPFSFCSEVGYDCRFTVGEFNIPQALQHFHVMHGAAVHFKSDVLIQLDNFPDSKLWAPSIIRICDGNDNNGDKFLFILCQIKSENMVVTCFQFGRDYSSAHNQVQFFIQGKSVEFPELEWTMSPVKYSEASLPLEQPPKKIPVELLRDHYLAKNKIIILLSVSFSPIPVVVVVPPSEPRASTSSMNPFYESFNSAPFGGAGVSNPTNALSSSSVSLFTPSAPVTVMNESLASFNPFWERAFWENATSTNFLGAAFDAPTTATATTPEMTNSNFHCQSSSHGSLTPTHSFDGLNCGACFAKPTGGIRYKCLHCKYFDICQSCLAKKVHALHIFALVKTPEQNKLVMEATPCQNGVTILSPPKISQGMFQVDWDWNIELDQKLIKFKRAICCCCGVKPIRGILYKCLQCPNPNFDMCQECVTKGMHGEHVVAVILTKSQNKYMDLQSRPVLN